MGNRLIADSTRRSVIRASIGQIDLSEWLFTLSDKEYQACSVAHIAAGSSRLPDGRRISVNVEKPGDTLMIQHYVEDTSEREQCRVVSLTDAFSPLGRTGWHVTWKVSAQPIDARSCEFTNHFEVTATDGFLSLLEANGVALEQVAKVAQKQADEHNEEETPLFAADIERKAQRGVWASSGIPSLA